jgi:hypothetical protein
MSSASGQQETLFVYSVNHSFALLAPFIAGWLAVCWDGKALLNHTGLKL